MPLPSAVHTRSWLGILTLGWQARDDTMLYVGIAGCHYAVYWHRRDDTGTGNRSRPSCSRVRPQLNETLPPYHLLARALQNDNICMMFSIVSFPIREK